MNLIKLRSIRLKMSQHRISLLFVAINKVVTKVKIWWCYWNHSALFLHFVLFVSFFSFFLSLCLSPYFLLSFHLSLQMKNTITANILKKQWNFIGIFQPGTIFPNCKASKVEWYERNSKSILCFYSSAVALRNVDLPLSLSLSLLPKLLHNKM